MARMTLGIVCTVDLEAADHLIELIRQQPDTHIIHIQQSCGKLWIKKGEQLRTIVKTMKKQRKTRVL